jgi:voltage-gated potassium channel
MTKVILSALALTVLTVVIHALGTLLVYRRVNRGWDERKSKQRLFPLTAEFLIARMVGGLLLLHLAEAIVWGLFFLLIGIFPGIESAVYFSLTSYTTVGYGDLLLKEPWRLLGPIEAAVGILMLGWSTGLLVALLTRIYGERKPA